MVSVAVSSLNASNIHVLEPGVKINGAYYRDVILRQMLLPGIGATSGSEFFVFQQDSVPSHRAKDTVALLDQETPILSHLLSGRLTHRTSIQLTTVCGVCFRNESIVPRSRTSTNWNDASTVSGPLWGTRLSNVLLVSGVSVYALVCWRRTFWAHDVTKMMWCNTCLFLRDNNCQSCCRYSVNHLMYT